MKYFAKKIRNEHGVFDSIAEYERFIYLKHQEDIGVISDLQRQVEFEIIPKLTKIVEVQLKTKVRYEERVDERPAHYTADFCYRDSDDKYIIEDLKSKYTQTLADYKLRKKLMKHIIAKHNKDVGFDDWEFKEVMSTPTKKKRNLKKI